MYTASELAGLQTRGTVQLLEDDIGKQQAANAARGDNGPASTWGPKAAVMQVAAKARAGGLHVAVYDMNNGDRFEVVVSGRQIYGSPNKRNIF